VVARRAEAIYYNGRVATFDSPKKTARAIAVSDGTIVAVGQDADIRRSAPRGCDKVDLGGRLVIPGFTDSHTHFIQMGVDSLSADLSSSRSLDEALAMMKSASERTPDGEWVIGTGWMESRWEGGRFIRREDLDRACPRHPAVAHRICGHLSSVNSKAIAALDIDGNVPDVETDASKRPTGVLRESAVGIVRAATAPDPKKRAKGLEAAIKKAHSLGVTSIQDNGCACDFAVYQQAEREGKLRVRVWFNVPSSELASLRSLNISTGLGSEMLKLGGLKVFCDGALGARTAAVSEPYEDDPGNKGMFVHGDAEFKEIVCCANEAGIQLAIHAIGDSGIELALSSISEALSGCRRRDHRHRIEHLELPSRRHIARMRKLGVLASMQPNFVGEWGGINGMYYSRLGASRAIRNNPFREVLDAGVKLVFGSDCMPFSPIYGIHSAVNAPHDSQRLSAAEAVGAYTRDAPSGSFEEGFKGRIRQGMAADFAVLSKDIFVDPERISEARVLKTVLGGEIVYDATLARTRKDAR